MPDLERYYNFNTASLNVYCDIVSNIKGNKTSVPLDFTGERVVCYQMMIFEYDVNR